MRNSRPLYQEIVSTFREKIESGGYLPGEKIESIAEIVKNYGVSRVTANRVICELEDIKLVKKLQGRGTFVNKLGNVPIAKVAKCEIKRVVFVSTHSHSSGNYFASDIFRGISAATQKNELDFSELINHHYQKQNSESFLPSMEDSGYIMVSSPENIQFIQSLFHHGHRRCVLIDNTFPGVESVLTDNVGGISQLIDHLCVLGHKKILFASRFSMDQGVLNENERVEAYKHEMGRRGLKPQIISSGNFDELLRIFSKKSAPTAVMFPQDDPALKFIRLLQEKGVKVPQKVSVTGFDDYSLREKGLEQLTTFRLGYYEMGVKAVELLLQEKGPDYMVPIWERIKGTLVTRKSTSKA